MVEKLAESAQKTLTLDQIAALHWTILLLQMLERHSTTLVLIITLGSVRLKTGLTDSEHHRFTVRRHKG
jgi:hypothetical protein